MNYFCLFLQQHGSSTSKKFREFESEFNNSMIFVSVFDRCSQYIQKLQGWCHFWVKAAQDRWWKWAVFCQIFDQSKPLATAAKWLQLQTLHSHTVSHIVPIPQINSKVQEVSKGTSHGVMPSKVETVWFPSDAPLHNIMIEISTIWKYFNQWQHSLVILTATLYFDWLKCRQKCKTFIIRRCDGPFPRWEGGKKL